MKMNLDRAQELIEPLRKGTAEGISPMWQERMIEALEYIIEREKFSHVPTGARIAFHYGAGVGETFGTVISIGFNKYGSYLLVRMENGDIESVSDLVTVGIGAHLLTDFQ
jgi:hypothetical protein